ncbi:MAG: heparan-alpha-glucosaminide N-acetyltransferase domain-containing protein [Dyella sp.]
MLPAQSSRKSRLDIVDMLRGLIIVLMVLDHARDYFNFHSLGFDPTDPATAPVATYFTRWITHLCAPTFLFLAGVGADLRRRNGAGLGDLSKFLVTRGLWLILLEITIISFGFNFGTYLFLQVVCAIGLSMIGLSALVWLPRAWLVVLGGAFIAASPALAAVTAHAQGAWAFVRTFTLEPGLTPFVPGVVLYPALPWLGVMCLGYSLSGLFLYEGAQRRKALALTGLILFVAFVVIRYINVFGDPSPWSAQTNAMRTIMSFLNVNKYPPSLDYVLATLGITLILASLLDRCTGIAKTVLTTYGRAPLFTYIVHIYILHGLQLLLGMAMGYPAQIFTEFTKWSAIAAMQHLEVPIVKANWGFSLPVVYMLWIAILAMVYPLSRWFARYRANHSQWWLSYL